MMNLPQCSPQLLLDSGFLPVYKSVLLSANHNITISNFMLYFLCMNKQEPQRQMVKAIYKKVLSGVDVKILSHYPIETQAKQLLGKNVRLYTGKGLLHSKFLIVDNQHLVVGSHNLTSRATWRNKEASIYFNDTDMCLEMERYFSRCWLDSKVY